MTFSLDIIVGWLAAYRYAVLLPIAIAEGPIISVIAGFLVSIGQMNFGIAFGLLVLGDVIGDFGLYSIGRWGGVKLIEKYGRRFGVTPARVEKLETFFEKHAAKTLLFGKWGHAFGFPILVSAGVAKEPPLQFGLISVGGTIPKTFILMFLGFYFGSSYGLIDHYFTYFAIGTVALVAIVGFGYWMFRKATRNYFSEL